MCSALWGALLDFTLEDTMKKLLSASVLGIALLTGSMAVAKPALNVGGKHPNLQAAQRLVEQAYEKITAAQKANEYELGGNAAKAKDLLEQVNNLLKDAAKVANEKK